MPQTDTAPRIATLSLGSNIHPRRQHLAAARLMISQTLGPIIEASSLYESEPWGFHSNVWFYNQVIHLLTGLPAPSILARTQAIELQLGRTRSRNGYASRTIDIDILLLGQEVHRTPLLTVPHPHIALRKFVLLPLLEIDPIGEHPTLHIPWRTLAQQCPDAGQIFRLLN